MCIGDLSVIQVNSLDELVPSSDYMIKLFMWNKFSLDDSFGTSQKNERTITGLIMKFLGVQKDFSRHVNG